MSQTLEITKPIIKKLEMDADDVKSSCGNEDYYTYNFLNHVHLPTDRESASTVNHSESDDLSKVLYECLHDQSHIYESDCSDESRKLATEYRKKLMSC